jgi:protein-glutamine gamma-glutamyltransferase
MKHMITINGTIVDPASLAGRQPWSIIQRETIERMADSSFVFAYPSEGVFRFELTLRGHMVEAARALNDSGVSFATFRKSRCNKAFWHLTDYGGFRIRDDVTPAEAIRDIFRNGRLYAFECATAMVIVCYRAVLESIEPDAFNRLFANILLYDWQYDNDLGLTTVEQTVQLPGDIVYFKNPDYHPDTPEWQGESAVVMGGRLYYGHGIGITTANRIIEFLNRERKPGATRSAYLMENATRPDFAYLYRFRRGAVPGMTDVRAGRGDRIVARIGSAYYEL